MICTAAGCSVSALLMVHWPSSRGPVAMCQVHAMHAFRTAEVMGFRLPMQPIDEEAKRLLEEQLHAHQAAERLRAEGGGA